MLVFFPRSARARGVSTGRHSSFTQYTS